MTSVPPLPEHQSPHNYPTTPPPTYESLIYENASSSQRIIDNGTVSIPMPSNRNYLQNFIYPNLYLMQCLPTYADIQQPGIGQPINNVQSGKKISLPSLNFNFFFYFSKSSLSSTSSCQKKKKTRWKYMLYMLLDILYIYFFLTFLSNNALYNF